METDILQVQTVVRGRGGVVVDGEGDAVEQDGAVSVLAGGVAGNIARSLAALSCNVTLSSFAGNDSLGLMLQSSFARAGVRGEIELIDDGVTSQASVVVNEDGRVLAQVRDFALMSSLDWPAVRRSFDAALASLPFAALVLDLNVADEATLLHFALSASARGIKIFIDPTADGLEARAIPILNAVEVEAVTPNELELAALGAANGADLLRLFPKLRNAIVTCGPNGAYAVCRGGETSRGAGIPPQPLVSTTGAGDAFMAGLVHSVACLGLGYPQALQRALQLASATCATADNAISRTAGG